MTDISDNQGALPPPPQPAPPPQPQQQKRKLFEPGTILADRYRVISVLGQGGMGVVYKAQHIHMEREMAIKTLANEMSPESEPFRRFKQEAKVIAALNHPNIVDIHDFAIEGNQAYLVMDYLDGIHIEKAIDEFGPMGLDHFIHIFSQACEAIQHAHNKGIIHRDLKGGNMMIVTEEDRRDILKVVDFGISKLLSDDDVEEDLVLTRTGKIVGSPLFMSPEQCLGHGFDHRVDIYSLGIVMYRSLTGELPLVGENAMKTLHKQITELPPPMSEMNPDVFVPQSLELVVRKALAKQADERHQTMLELLQDLREAVRVPDLSIAREEDSALIPAVEPIGAFPLSEGNKPSPAEGIRQELTGTDFAHPGIEGTDTELAPPSPPDSDDDWKKLTAGAGLTSVPPPSPDRAQLDAIPRPQPPLPAQPSLPAGVSSNAFAQRWRATSQPMQIQRPNAQPPASAQRVPLPGSGSYQAYIAGTRSPEAPKPRSKVNPALFKFGQFEAPPEGLPAIPPSQSFKKSVHGSSSSISHGAYQGGSSQAKDPGPGSMKEQLDQIIRRSASQAKIDKIIEEQDQLAASKRNMPAYQPSSSSKSSSFRPPSGGAKKDPDVQESTSGGVGKVRPPRYKSAPVVDEFFLDKLVDKFVHPFRKLFEKKEETYVQQVSAPNESNVSPMTLLMFVVAPVVVVGFLAWQFWPRSTTVDQAYGRVPHVYKSADGQVSFQLTGTTSCELKVDDRRNSTSCRFYLNDWRDAVEVALGYPFQNQYWLYETRDGIADDADNSFYGAYSPEAELAEKIDSVGKYATACYKKNGRYPDSAKVLDVDGVNLKYKNPFTKDSEVPSFQSVTISSGDDEASDKKKRKKFFANMRKGRSWEDAPEEHAGQIRCCAVTFKNAKGDSQAFVAQIIGRNGKPMRGFNSESAYFYALENGKPYDEFSESDAPKFPFTQNRGQPDVVWFFVDDKPDADLVSFFKNGANYLFGLLAVMVLLLVLSSKSLIRNLMRR